MTHKCIAIVYHSSIDPTGVAYVGVFLQTESTKINERAHNYFAHGPIAREIVFITKGMQTNNEM